MLTYQNMVIDDYKEISAFWRSIPGLILNETDSYESVQAYLKHNPWQSFVCKDDGRIVGTILCGNDGRRAYIHQTAVLPEYRMFGIAKELVDLSMKMQRQLGMERCHLFIVPDGSLSNNFWNEMGFSQRTDLNIMSLPL